MKRQRRGMAILALGAAALVGCARPTKGDAAANSPEAWREALQPALSAGAAAQLASAPDLAGALRLALERNPGLMAEKSRWLAAIRREPQAVTPEDPMLGIEYQLRGMEARDGLLEWEIAQAIPWWRKLWSRGRIAAAESDIARLKYEASARDLIIDVKDSWYELYYLDQAQDITAAIEGLLRNEALLAYQELTSGRTQLGEALRAESQAAQLAYDRFLLAEQRAAQAERLRFLLNLPPGAEIGPVSSAPSYALASAVEPLYERAESYAEMLKIQGLELEKSRYETYLARLSRIPDIALGLTVMEPEESAPMEDPPPGAGETPVIGMLSMNLPIFEWRNRALIREKKALEEAMAAQALDEANRVRAGVASAYFEARLMERLRELYAMTLLPQAEAALSQAETFFRSDAGAFSSVVETTLAYHNFQLAYHRAAADYGQALGRLERIVGSTAEGEE